MLVNKFINLYNKSLYIRDFRYVNKTAPISVSEYNTVRYGWSLLEQLILTIIWFLLFYIVTIRYGIFWFNFEFWEVTQYDFNFIKYNKPKVLPATFNLLSKKDKFVHPEKVMAKNSNFAEYKFVVTPIDTLRRSYYKYTRPLKKAAYNKFNYDGHKKQINKILDIVLKNKDKRFNNKNEKQLDNVKQSFLRFYKYKSSRFFRLKLVPNSKWYLFSISKKKNKSIYIIDNRFLKFKQWRKHLHLGKQFGGLQGHFSSMSISYWALSIVCLFCIANWFELLPMYFRYCLFFCFYLCLLILEEHTILTSSKFVGGNIESLNFSSYLNASHYLQHYMFHESSYFGKLDHFLNFIWPWNIHFREVLMALGGMWMVQWDLSRTGYGYTLTEFFTESWSLETFHYRTTAFPFSFFFNSGVKELVKTLKKKPFILSISSEQISSLRNDVNPWWNWNSAIYKPHHMVNNVFPKNSSFNLRALNYFLHYDHLHIGPLGLEIAFEHVKRMYPYSKNLTIQNYLTKLKIISNLLERRNLLKHKVISRFRKKNVNLD